MSKAGDVTFMRLRIAMINLVVVAIIGSLLRYYFYQPFPGFVYTYTLHAHSHLAFLGWVFMALYSLLVYAFLPPDLVAAKKYRWFFWIFQVANIGMLFTFPFTGYAFWSIIFSSVHALGAIAFAILFISDARRHIMGAMKTPFAFAKWALILMILSNLAPFALVPVSATQGKTDLYYLLIYFYLHFQYNGWFTFALIGLLLWLLERKGLQTNHRWVKLGFILKLVAVFPAYILSALWTGPDPVWYIVGGVAAFIQLVGLAFLLMFIASHRKAIQAGSGVMAKVLFISGLAAIVSQHVLQLLSAVPNLEQIAFARNIVVAYLHMVLIGFVTFWILTVIESLGFFKKEFLVNKGFLVLLFGFLLSEMVLLVQPILLVAPALLFALALVQLVGIIVILSSMYGSAIQSKPRFFSEEVS